MKKKVKIMAGTLLATMLLTNNVFAYNIQKVSVDINDMLQPIKSKVINKDGHILVAFRELFDILGAKVKWNDIKRDIEAKKGNYNIIIDVDSDKMKFNDKYYDIDVEILDGTTYVGLRTICEALGMKVNWEEAKNNISIDTNQKGYIYLVEEDSAGKKITQEDAFKIAKQNNSNIKNLNDNIEYTKDVINNLGDKIVGLDYYNPAVEQILQNMNELNGQIEDSDLNKKIMEDGIEFSIISSAYAIKATKLNIMLIEKSIELSEKNLEAMELKYKYGMISENELKQAKDNLKTNKDNLENLKASLETQKKNLANIIGTSEEANIDIVLESDFSKIDNIKLDSYILRQKEGDLSIQILKKQLKRIEDKKENYSHNATDEEKQKLDNDIKATQRKITDAQNNMENKIRTSYDNLVNLREKDKKLKIDLQKSKDDYNKTVANYINGNATLNNVYQAEFNILNIEKQIEENKNSFSLAYYTFNKPYLNQ